ncbi:MAG TPA: zinc-binding alcohol dehydrogenase family protein [Candidatus Acidoferrales bacterium]|nr:zinc-binding alcohol dehydrogenase family protein [Candidatus Acidoferrales bacterium]
MKAAVLHRLGVTPRCEDFAEPTAQDGEALIRVRAASLKSVEKQMAAGSHYASPKEFPAICGLDGVGELEDGTRVFFGGPRKPFGAMAERTVAPRAFCFSLPPSIDDATAAALPNPGISAYLVLTQNAKLVQGERVLILGATGIAGKLAVQIAKLLGASSIVAGGRNPEALNNLRELGADATIQLDQTEDQLQKSFSRESGKEGFNVVIDYVWGKPTEAFLAAMTQSEFMSIGSETRLIQVGESAAPVISLPAAVLRSRALTIRGTAGIPPRDALATAMKQVMDWAAAGLLRIETQTVPLTEIEEAWSRPDRSRRLVVIP